MRKIVLVPLAAILALVFFGDVAKAYEIQGYVYNSAGKGIPDVWIELLDDVYTVITRVRTNATGHYSFKNLPSENDYIIRVLTDGIHIGQERRVETGRDSATQHESTDFYLKAHAEFEDQTEPPTPGKKAAESPAGVKAPSVPKVPPPTSNEVFVQEVPPTARAAYQEGIRLLDTNPDAGRAKLKEAIQLFPDYFAALERYGVECVKAGRWEAASTAVSHAIAINPRSHVSYYTLGVAQFQLKQLPESIQTLQQMFSMAPDSPNGPYARYCLGVALLKTGKPAEAELELKLAKQQGLMKIPSDIHLALAQIYSSTNRYAEAADEIEQLLQEEPGRVDAESLRELITHLRAKAR